MKQFLLLLLFAAVCSAGPIGVLITGNFGAPTVGTSILDNQNHSISYTVYDPHSPSASFGDANSANATYQVPVRLNIPGLSVSVTNIAAADYRNQHPLGLWLNRLTFTGLPVGDFMVMTPLRTSNGEPLWNGVAGGTGIPELLPLNNAPAHARFFLEQGTPPNGPYPVAVYDGTAFISQSAAVPEPGSSALPAEAFLIAVATKLRRRARLHRG